MGYKPGKEKALRITYADFDGLEVYATTPPMGELMDIADQKLNMNAAADQRMRVFDTFAKYIKTWNIEHPEPTSVKREPRYNAPDEVVCARCGLAEDMPLPTTGDAMLCLPMNFIMPVFFGWLTSVSRVDPTKYLPTSSGEKNSHTDLMKMLGEMQNPTPSNVPNLS